jgi:hypothetical protein
MDPGRRLLLRMEQPGKPGIGPPRPGGDKHSHAFGSLIGESRRDQTGAGPGAAEPVDVAAVLEERHIFRSAAVQGADVAEAARRVDTAAEFGTGHLNDLAEREGTRLGMKSAVDHDSSSFLPAASQSRGGNSTGTEGRRSFRRRRASSLISNDFSAMTM